MDCRQETQVKATRRRGIRLRRGCTREERDVSVRTVSGLGHGRDEGADC